MCPADGHPSETSTLKPAPHMGATGGSGVTSDPHTCLKNSLDAPELPDIREDFFFVDL